MSNVFILIYLGGGGVKFMKHLKGVGIYKCLETYALKQCREVVSSK
jgi:hypothetical protein